MPTTFTPNPTDSRKRGSGSPEPESGGPFGPARGSYSAGCAPSRHIAPRRPGRAVLALAVFGATSGLIACEGKVGVNPTGAGGKRRRHRQRRRRNRQLARRSRLRHRRLRQRWLRHGRHGRHPGADHAGRLRDLSVRGRRAGRDAAREAVDVSVPEHGPRSPERERPVGGRDEVAPMLAAIPDDSTLAFRGLDARISSDHIQGYFNVATAVANAATSTSSRLTTLAGSVRRDVAAGHQLPGRLPRLVRQARLSPPAGRDRARRVKTSRRGRRPPRPTPPR